MRIVECGQDSALELRSVDCVNILYICYIYILPALLIIRVVHHQVTRLQELTYRSTSFPLGDATGSTNRRLYATTGTITSPLLKTGPTGHYLAPTGDFRFQLSVSNFNFLAPLVSELWMGSKNKISSSPIYWLKNTTK